MKVELSIVIPIYCEAESLPSLYQRLTDALAPVDRAYELIFVDDSSTDASPALLTELRQKDMRVKFLRLSRNFGHQAAITAGLEAASGTWVIVMDGDLQDPPEVVPQLLDRQEETGADVVYAVREKRPEQALFRAMNSVFYRMMRLASSTPIPSEAGDFCLMHRRVVDELCRLPERHRFIRGLRAWVGFSQASVTFERPRRHAGSAKYTWPGRTRLALDALFGFSYLPLRISTALGALLSLSGLGYALYIFIGRMSGRFTIVPGWATVVISVLVLGGVQLLMLGIIGEYLGRIYEELKQRPHYIVETREGFDGEKS